MSDPKKLIEMYIDVASQLPHLWYENEDGERWIPPPNFPNPDCMGPPPGFKYQHSMFPHVLRHTCLKDRVDGSGSDEVYAGHSTWSEDLVTAMVKSGEHGLFDSIMIAAHACERCMNSLAEMYGLDWGYPEFGPEWQKTGTECQFCNKENNHDQG